MPPDSNASVDILGTPISIITWGALVDCIDHRPADRPLTIGFCNVHSVMSTRSRSDLSDALRSMDVNAPDGMPLVWWMRLIDGLSTDRLRGPTFMRQALQAGVGRDWTHFFYGTTDETLAALVSATRSFAPGIRVVGTHAPPYRDISEDELDRDIEMIKTSGADLVWVGLGMPKQELWIHRTANRLPGVTLLGVGAAFDLIAGNVPEAPAWMQKVGLEWLFRLMREPRRLWRRYVFNNPAFLILMSVEVIRRRLIGHVTRRA